MASCVRNICTKNYQNLIIAFKVTVKNVVDVFLRHSVHALQTDDDRRQTSYQEVDLTVGQKHYTRERSVMSVLNFLNVIKLDSVKGC